MTDNPRPQSHADAAPGRPRESDEDPNAPYARRIDPTEDDDQLSKKRNTTEDRQEALIDESVEETFPASDPITPKHIT
ncbi:MAG: hypothetical protein KKA16_04455 [Alphaproteobacteria bacterium]|nr:hypothetical protein [Alphaproteobacteria bacterium]MBU2380018.1 hypothetical protein [Alphaproteobacteria bacterium]